MDGGDCLLDCSDGVCGQYYLAWLYLAGSSHQVNHTVVCADIWSSVIALIDPFEDVMECNTTLIDYDYNEDGFTDFREFIAIAYASTGTNWDGDDLPGSHQFRGGQINCSSCVGVEYYVV